MLDFEQAGQIVVDCIRAVSHEVTVDITGSLDDNRISDTARKNNMLTLIVNSSNIGVPSQNHRINAGWFNAVDTDTIVTDVIAIVEEKATEIHTNLLEDFASMVAAHVTLNAKTDNKKKTLKPAKGNKTASKKSGRSNKNEK